MCDSFVVGEIETERINIWKYAHKILALYDNEARKHKKIYVTFLCLQLWFSLNIL